MKKKMKNPFDIYSNWTNKKSVGCFKYKDEISWRGFSHESILQCEWCYVWCCFGDKNMFSLFMALNWYGLFLKCH